MLGQWTWVMQTPRVERLAIRFHCLLQDLHAAIEGVRAVFTHLGFTRLILRIIQTLRPGFFFCPHTFLFVRFPFHWG